jgi:hypothetical protein
MHKPTTKITAHMPFENAHYFVVLPVQRTNVKPAVFGYHQQERIAEAEFFDFNNVLGQQLAVVAALPSQ